MQEKIDMAIRRLQSFLPLVRKEHVRYGYYV